MLNRGTIKLLVFSTTSKSFLAQPAQNISSSSIVSAGKVWRQSNNLPKLQTARGPLIDLPDYSFVGKERPMTLYFIEIYEILIRKMVDQYLYQ